MMVQMGVRTFHQHHHAEKETVTCNDCSHHKIHDGHILSWDGGNDNCTLCQLLTTPFTECSATEIFLQPLVYLNEYFCSNCAHEDYCISTHYLRGPPSFIL